MRVVFWCVFLKEQRLIFITLSETNFERLKIHLDLAIIKTLANLLFVMKKFWIKNDLQIMYTPAPTKNKINFNEF